MLHMHESLVEPCHNALQGLIGLDLPNAGLIVDVLEHPAAGNAFLLIASFVGVGGSYLLYLKRKIDSREKLRGAIESEIRQMSQIPDTVENLNGLSTPPPESKLTASSVPPAEAFPTTVYEENASEFGLLVEEELENVVDFYTILIQHKGIIRGIRDDAREVPMPDHEKIVDEFSELANRREDLLRQLEISEE